LSERPRSLVRCRFTSHRRTSRQRVCTTAFSASPPGTASKERQRAHRPYCASAPGQYVSSPLALPRSLPRLSRSLIEWIWPTSLFKSLAALLSAATSFGSLALVASVCRKLTNCPIAFVTIGRASDGSPLGALVGLIDVMAPSTLDTSVW